LEDFTLVVNEDIRTQLTHHVGRHWMIDQLTVADIEDMLPFLPDDITQVVDLCCGSGRVSIAFDKLVTHGKAKFWLVDGNVQNEVENIKRHWDKYHNDRIARFYNKRELTEECCRLNSFSNYEYVEVDGDLNWSTLPTDVDVLFSNRGIGCHPESVQIGFPEDSQRRRRLYIHERQSARGNPGVLHGDRRSRGKDSGSRADRIAL